MQNIYEVYIDSLFLMNFIMNMYLYTLSAKTLKRTATRVRIFAGSGISALLLTLFLLIPGIPVFIKRFAGPIAVSMIITGVVFRIKSIIEILRTTGYMFLYAFVLGGLMKFLFAGFPFFEGKQRSMWYILGVGIIGYQVVSWWITQVSKRKSISICRVRLIGYENKIELDALIDTGNSLTEPISGKPVSVIEGGILDELTGIKVQEKLKAIPYRSVGKNNGIMMGYEIPEIIIMKENEKIRWQKVIVGISSNKVSADGKYQMILHPDLCSEAIIRKPGGKADDF